MRKILTDLAGSYGSFLFFRRPQASLLLVACTMLEPRIGAFGLLGGLAALVARHLLAVPATCGKLDIVNAVLAGLYFGTTFAWDPRGLLLVAASGALSVLLGIWLQDLLVRRARLPMLSAPFCLLAAGLLAVGRALALPYAPLPQSWALDAAFVWLPALGQKFLYSLGAIYFAPSLPGGLLVLAAIAVSSRMLVLVAVLGFATVEAMFALLALPAWSLAHVPAGAAGILTAIMAGGLFARPSGRALAVCVLGAACTALLSLALTNALWYMALPALSLPFLLGTWLLMTALATWQGYWLAEPDLPERSGERDRIAEARGLSRFSIALRAPFFGAWDVYQGFDGPHTHRGLWRHGLDFLRLEEGRAHRGTGTSLEDYHCFGAPVCAPAYGWVVACRGDLPDNPPGETDLANRWGNFVMIALATGDHVVLAHLQQDSVTVAVGSYASPGQVIARCGNSGRSPQPHLHLHVQSGPWLGDPTRPFHLSGICLERPESPVFVLDAVPAERDLVTVPALNPALASSLHWAVGRRFSFESGGGEPWSLEVDLDVFGQQWLRAPSGARIAVTETADLLALHDRDGIPDVLLDAFALAAGLTPFVEAASSWRDVPPLRLLPMPLRLRGLVWLLPGLIRADSRYDRRWDAAGQCWVQSGWHRIQLVRTVLWSCRSMVQLSESHGVTGFAIETGCQPGPRAGLVSHGLRGDIGIAGWEARVERVM